ncbi:sigma-70 family RNA polymerase sigma factor [Limnoglobus roseus]|uniref:RNA polymerase sigma factor n=1 Tax=Limnoglobus roseus TaxID=2598579 RepID=A0A5C1AGI3_9BACT|nr:sigma-70 family RNA polymerase sigma factor [Limnoglobus roseus]QEL17755.1 RNA polymerase sigma factor [Limnoglobus roseus]
MTDADVMTGPTTDPGSDPRAWLDRHGDALYRFALARVRRADVAEDLVQETLLSAWRGREGFRGTSSEQTWLTAILKRKVIDWLRHRIRERVTDLGPDGFTDSLFTRRGDWKVPPARCDRGSPTTPLERDEFWATLHACLGKLPSRLHDVFVLRYLDEVAGDAACRELGLTPSNLWVMLHRARLRMWACLSENWFRDEPPREGIAP